MKGKNVTLKIHVFINLKNKLKKKIRKIDSNIVDLSKETLDFINNSSITSILYYEKGKVIHDLTKSNLGIFNTKKKITNKTYLYGFSKSKSIASLMVGVTQCFRVNFLIQIKLMQNLFQS